MADLGDVLRHLVANAPGLGEDHRAEFRAAVDEAYPPPPPPPAPELDPAEKEARRAQLRAELDALDAPDLRPEIQVLGG